jgi:histidyl-tRNA synthetase
LSRFEAPRGTHDILPAEQPLWRHVVAEAERLCALAAYRRIDTPTFEDTDLFVRTAGEGSDVVRKEMYTFDDRGERSLTLRPEGTAPICRAYLEHGLHREPQPQKLYTVAPMFRYGRPQRGRFREHWQLSVEAIGSDDPALDAEINHLYDTLQRTLGVREYRLELNSIGDRECRPAYLDRLRAWLDEHGGELDADTREQAARSPLRALDNLAARPPETRAVLERAPTIGDSLCAACSEHFAAVRSLLDASGVRYELVPTLVRGLDYYTRTTWEFVGPDEGGTSTISGGGRYDGLVEELGGPPTPGVGFGAGIERLLLALEGAGVTVDAAGLDVFFVLEDGAPRDAMLGWVRELRGRGVSCDSDFAGRSVKGQLTQSNRLGARATVIVTAAGATLRRAGQADEPLPHDAIVGKLSS